MFSSDRKLKPTVEFRFLAVPPMVVLFTILAIIMVLPGSTQSVSDKDGPEQKVAVKSVKRNRDGANDVKEQQPLGAKDVKKEQPAEPEASPAGGWERAAIQSPDRSGMVIPRVTFS